MGVPASWWRSAPITTVVSHISSAAITSASPSTVDEPTVHAALAAATHAIRIVARKIRVIKSARAAPPWA